MGGTLRLQGGLRRRSEKRKDIDSDLTQSQLTELLETESAVALIAAGEERGGLRGVPARARCGTSTPPG